MYMSESICILVDSSSLNVSDWDGECSSGAYFTL